ncbi:hypothetical protein, partial [Crocosphaera watsonii]|uniref:Ig-like domain-containing protein n=1 Tax=Crocosphaera watsonii TaxID=263511 RepID=UPI0006501008
NQDVIRLTGATDFITTSNRFQTEFTGFMPGDVFTNAQLDTKVQTEATSLQTAVEADYNPVNNGTGTTGYTFVNSGGDITMTWLDQGSGIYGSADYDSNEAFLRPLITDGVISNAAKEWALAEALNQDVSNSGSFAVAINTSWTSGATFAQFMANTVSHEIAHTLGLNDSYLNLPGGGAMNIAVPGDIMRAGDDGDGDLTFAAQNNNLLRAALGIHQNADKPLTAELQMYRDNINLPGNAMGIRDPLAPDQQFAELGVTTTETNVFPEDEVSLGIIAADGVDGELTTIELTLTNIGLAPLTLDTVTLTDGSQGFSIVDPESLDTSLEIEESTNITLQFDPIIAGSLSDTLTIASDAHSYPSFEINLNGQGIAATPLAEITLAENNNLGGVAVASGIASVNQFATITNNGAETLTISGIALVDGNDTFTLSDIPT